MTSVEKLLKFIKDYPGLPIVFMVNGELCCGEDYYWLGGFEDCAIDEYAIVDGQVLFESDIINPNETSDVDWTRAIIVYIGFPEERSMSK